jgi:hypothetical protein
MPYIQIPLRGAARTTGCDKERTQDFLDKSAQLSSEVYAAVERLVDSFDGDPGTDGDIQLPGTVIGTAHARVRDGAYVLYQQFSQEGARRYLIKLWYCGVYDVPVGSGRFDFQNEDEAV